METANFETKPGVIVLGGCGFIGRNLVEYLLDNELVSYVRVIDKVPPQTAWLNKKHQRIFEHPLLEFRSANLINSASCDNAFAGEQRIDIVFNCAGETKYGQTDPVYKDGIHKLSMNCAQKAAELGVQRYIEISSGHLSSSEKVPHKEDDEVDPWTFIAKHKVQVENDLKNIPGLKFTIFRPAIIYGPGDRNSLAPRLVVGAVYKHLGEMMKLLWGPNLRMNTVHVRDVVRAMWHVTRHPNTIGQIYNVVDESDSTQGSISALVSELFNINHDYWGAALSMLAKVDMTTIVEEVNDKHMSPWAEACSKDGVENSPLSPYINRELLYNKNLYLQPGKLSSTTNFTYLYPKLMKESLKEVVDDYVEMKIFPHSLVL
ncbi:uncharacterized protein YbjS isoform X1 [Neodiprion virginianus]|uniref:Uncharacterized protein YbjS isoform X1 n=1 Tax=Neodiprion lecontei TaxID=441921 RepID=A0A6J0BJY2_NEOLC|nr:uncharacterized protein YbjS isoform X1 [Neodiprion lecontei]XP_046607720.1 uncharacterized protein YbjS isoform X1 [Neodiprion virginianus]